MRIRTPATTARRRLRRRRADQLDEALLQRAALAHRVERPAGDDAAAGQHRDRVAELLDQRHHVAGHEHGAAAGHEPGEDALDRGRGDRVHGLERLVEHEQPRRVQQRGGQPDHLPHPGGVVDDQRPLGVPAQLQHVEQLVRPAGHRGAVEPARLAQVAEQLAARELLGQREPVGQHAEHRAGLQRAVPHVGAEHARAPGVRPQQPDRHRQRGRLPGAVGTDEPEEGARRHGEAERVDRHVVAEGLAQPGELERGPRARQSHPFSSAIRSASPRLRAPSLRMAALR